MTMLITKKASCWACQAKPGSLPAYYRDLVKSTSVSDVFNRVDLPNKFSVCKLGYPVEFVPQKKKEFNIHTQKWRCYYVGMYIPTCKCPKPKSIRDFDFAQKYYRCRFSANEKLIAA